MPFYLFPHYYHWWFPSHPTTRPYSVTYSDPSHSAVVRGNNYCLLCKTALPELLMGGGGLVNANTYLSPRPPPPPGGGGSRLTWYICGHLTCTRRLYSWYCQLPRFYVSNRPRLSACTSNFQRWAKFSAPYVCFHPHIMRTALSKTAFDEGLLYCHCHKINQKSIQFLVQDRLLSFSTERDHRRPKACLKQPIHWLGYVTISFGCILYCGCFNLFCNLWVFW
jgi:hypothetical protein